MRSILRPVSLASIVVLAVLAAACKKKVEAPAPTPEVSAPMPTVPAVLVTEVQLGNALTPEKKVVAVMETFAPKDTIFVSVATQGTSPSATLGARWTMADGTLVDEGSRAIVPSGNDVTEFSIQKPDGWPAGDYKVEITLDGAPVATKVFKVS